MAGINRWKSPELRALQHKREQPKDRVKPCVFISYRLLDSAVAGSVAAFLMEADIDVYFSDRDAVLMKALDDSNDRKIVQSIDAGIAEATHLLGIISNQTRGSWWVPYEFGACRVRNVDIALLVLEEVTELPSYMKIAQVLADAASVTVWASKVNPVVLKSASGLRVLQAPRVSPRSREIRYVSWLNILRTTG